MPGSFEFKLEGLDELKADLEKVYREYPDRAAKEIYHLGGVFTKDVNEKMPDGYSEGEKGLKKNWHRTRVSGLSGATVAVEVENKANHWHLVENGHELMGYPDKYSAHKKGEKDKKKSGATRKLPKKVRQNMLVRYGWVPGKFYCEKTRDEWQQGVLALGLAKFIDKIFKDHNL